MFQRLALLAVFLAAILSLSWAIPTWEGVARAPVGSLAGISYIEALHHQRSSEVFTPKHLNVPVPGSPGNLTISSNSKAPPLFYIYQNRLWQMVNETSIFHVSVVNTTTPFPGTTDIPMQLVLDTKRSGITGSWSWRGTMLLFDRTGMTSSPGPFYTCTGPTGETGVFLFLKPSPTPAECRITTLHSFTRNIPKN
ncbi:hypothetical protein C8J56DRAFT_1047287 [Mycena floridula]|nr:hypothetical protein C8J56DRAFT_1047287 [Mycena floridula]